MGAVTKGLRILETVVATGTAGMPFSRVTARTGIPKATAHRLLKELESLSALTYDPRSRRYFGGLLLARLGAGVVAGYDIRRVAQPHLEALHRETGFVATLGVLNDDAGTYLDKFEGSDFGIRLHSEIGKAFPLYCTALGKVLLANAGPSLLRRIAARKLTAFTENTITGAAALRDEIADVRRHGYAVDREEITRGLVCIAAPVFGVEGEPAGAISCTFPSYVQAESGIDIVRDAVIRQAAAASGAAAPKGAPHQ